MKTILSLFDYSGNWAAPYLEKSRTTGEYDVYHVDLKSGVDVNDFNVAYLVEQLELDLVHGILAAPPCTDFSSSGARWWRGKDECGATDQSLELVYQVLRTVEYFQPKWWVIENPVGRLPSLITGLGKPQYFQPCDFGDPYTKKTGLWGDFIFPDYSVLGSDWSVEPTEGSMMHRCYGGKSERTKERRSITPPGFARAFHVANP